MSYAETIYQALPIPLQSLAINMWGAAWAWRRYGKHFRSKLAELRARDNYTQQQFAELTLQKLNTILHHARKAPFYCESFASHGVPDQLTNIDDIRRIPILTKQMLREHSDELLTTTPPKGTQVFHSSGSTGTPIKVYYTRAFHQDEMAYFQARVRDWAGISPHARRAMFGIRKICSPQQKKPPFWRSSVLENLIYYSNYHLAPENIGYYVENLRRTRPQLLMGFPSAMNIVAQWLLEHGERLSIPVAITTSETVTAETRANIEQAFQCRLHDQYGAVENVLFGSQCAYGSYHLSPERGYVEILNDQNEPCPPGVEGRVVATGLENTLHPLIRYELGDVAAWAENQRCPCGRNLPVLAGISGRVEDYCVAPDGRRIFRFDTVFRGLGNIKEGQVVQESMDRFTLNIVVNERFNDQDRLLLIENFRALLPNVQVNIQILSKIPRTSAGKLKVVINLSGLR